VKNIAFAAATASTAALLLSLNSTAVAAATPDVIGMTYDKASSALSGAGLKASVATRVGDQKSQGDCVVTSARVESVPQSGNHPTTGTKVSVSLNCYAAAASVKSPGFSAASPEGKAAAAAAAAAAAKKSGA
jgi:beta-lactam-binding protein with PASTA domain